MVHLWLFLAVAKHSFAALALLLPMLPLPLVLILERRAVSKFSPVEAYAFRMGYVFSVLSSVYVTYVLGIILWN